MEDKGAICCDIYLCEVCQGKIQGYKLALKDELEFLESDFQEEEILDRVREIKEVLK